MKILSIGYRAGPIKSCRLTQADMEEDPCHSSFNVCRLEACMHREHRPRCCASRHFDGIGHTYRTLPEARADCVWLAAVPSVVSIGHVQSRFGQASGTPHLMWRGKLTLPAPPALNAVRWARRGAHKSSLHGWPRGDQLEGSRHPNPPGLIQAASARSRARPLGVCPTWMLRAAPPF